MRKKKIMLVGGGGREHAFAKRLCTDAVIYAIMGHANPGMIECVEKSGGAYHIDDANDPLRVLHVAQQYPLDYVFVSADTPLSKGVVDTLLAHHIPTVGGTKAATRIEWDKIYSIEMINNVCPEFTPFYRIICCPTQLSEALKEFQRKKLQVVVKPQGLTGGKGVKVMPEHLSDYQHAYDYAHHLLTGKDDDKVLLVERLHGREFTIMGLTDGINLLMCPATYDYPFRFENDKGAGTGGMGCFTTAEHKLPFMSDKDWQDCRQIMEKMIATMHQQRLSFKGVLNGGFFSTPQGIRFMEFNGRFGDPEALNILSLMQGSFADLIADLWHQRLSENSIRFNKKASVVKYLVAKEYPEKSPEALDFNIDETKLSALGIDVIYSSCVRHGKTMRTLKGSRVVALSTLSDTINEAAQRINDAISTCVEGQLDYRKDIGSIESLQPLTHPPQ